jgi:hypothetical protein
MIRSIVQKGRLDILANNAGIIRDGLLCSYLTGTGIRS